MLSVQLPDDASRLLVKRRVVYHLLSFLVDVLQEYVVISHSTCMYIGRKIVQELHMYIVFHTQTCQPLNLNLLGTILKF